jgi:mono/diheme cytochrome c family protein
MEFNRLGKGLALVPGAEYRCAVRFARTLVALSAILACAACGEDARNLREWTAADHQQPQQPDPSRTPGGQVPQQEAAAVEASPEQIQRAAASLFEASCARCHGAAGAGDGAAAPVADMPDMTSEAWHAANTDADIARAIRMGQGLMPAFGGQLNERGIEALVGHIRRMRPTSD